VESTVVSLTTEVPRILRPGAVTPEQLEAVLGYSVDIDKSAHSSADSTAPVSSPGIKHKHYSPKAQVTLLDGSAEQVIRFLNEQKEDGVYALVYDEDMQFLPLLGYSLGKAGDADEHAFRLFAALRELDEKGAKKIYARVPQKDGIGLAVYNRLIRAAEFDVIKL
jgi:L-threonylcarbamoyladenylate synthase